MTPASPLHAARAFIAVAYVGAVIAVVLAFENPIALAAAAVAIIGAAMLAGAGRALLRAALFGVPFALLVALVNPLVAGEGLTVLARLGELGPLGRVDITGEGLIFGAILGLRALLIVLASAALLTAVDADELLRGARRVSGRAALTAALAVRLVPVLGRDARRLADARRCRPDASAKPAAAERLQIVRAVMTGALDRALDVAATLEVRGYATAAPASAVSTGGGRQPRPREPWSRHDLAVAASALGLIALAAGARLLGIAGFDAYPRTLVAAGLSEWLLAAAIVVVALAPFADRRGIAR